jgi:hypothetical protein
MKGIYLTTLLSLGLVVSACATEGSSQNTDDEMSATEQSSMDEGMDEEANSNEPQTTEPNDNENMEPNTEPASEPSAEPEAGEPTAEPSAEPAAMEPTSEPTSEPSAMEPTSEPTSEPSAMEPSSEPASEPESSVSELFGADNAPDLGAQIDRTGRAAINTALNQTFSDDTDAKGMAKDAYNQAGRELWSEFVPAFEGSLAILDALDGACGNQLLASDEGDAGRYNTLAGILSDDQLYVHSERGECGTYLGLEAEIVGALPEGAGGCGGRMLADDVIERSYSVLAAGILAGVDDLVTEDDGDHSDVFPFVGAPTL